MSGLRLARGHPRHRCLEGQAHGPHPARDVHAATPVVTAERQQATATAWPRPPSGRRPAPCGQALRGTETDLPGPLPSGCASAGSAWPAPSNLTQLVWSSLGPSSSGAISESGAHQNGRRPPFLLHLPSSLPGVGSSRLTVPSGPDLRRGGLLGGQDSTSHSRGGPPSRPTGAEDGSGPRPALPASGQWALTAAAGSANGSSPREAREPFDPGGEASADGAASLKRARRAAAMAGCHNVVLLLDTAGGAAGQGPLRRAALRLLAYLGCRFGLARVRWAFRLFDSQGARGGPARAADFRELGARAGEELEAALAARLAAGAPGAHLPGPAPRAVHTRGALLEALLDYEWDRPEISSPAKPALRRRGARLPDAEGEAAAARGGFANAVFLLAACPHSRRELLQFASGGQAQARGPPPSRAQLMDTLLPRRVQEVLVARRITLYWVDTTERARLWDSPDHLGYWTVQELLLHLGGSLLPPEAWGQDSARAGGAPHPAHLSAWPSALPADSVLNRLLHQSPEYEAAFPRVEGMLFLPVEGKESQETWAVILEPLVVQQRHFQKPVRVFLTGAVRRWSPPASSSVATDCWMLHSPEAGSAATGRLFQQLVSRLTAGDVHLVASVDAGEGWPPATGVISPLSVDATVLTVFRAEAAPSQGRFLGSVEAESSRDAASLFFSVVDDVLGHGHSSREDPTAPAPRVPEWVQQELGRTARWSPAVVESWFLCSNLSGASSDLMESFWLLQAASAGKEESSAAEGELTRRLSELYQRRSREDAAAAGQEDSRKKRGVPRTPVRQKMNTMCRSLKMLNVARLNVKAQKLHPDGSPEAGGEKGTQKTAGGRAADRPESRGRVLRSSKAKEFKTEEELLAHIRESYQKTVAEGHVALHPCAQNMVSTFKAFLKSTGTRELEVNCLKQIKNNLLKSSRSLRQDIGKSPDKGDTVRECQLQVLLRLEMCLQCPSVQDRAEDVEQLAAELLRIVCLTEDLVYLASFLEEILGLYIDSIPRMLGELYDSLGLVAPQKLASVLPADFFSDDSLTQERKSPLPSEPPLSRADRSASAGTESDQLEELRSRSAKKRREGLAASRSAYGVPAGRPACSRHGDNGHPALRQPPPAGKDAVQGTLSAARTFSALLLCPALSAELQGPGGRGEGSLAPSVVGVEGAGCRRCQDSAPFIALKGRFMLTVGTCVQPPVFRCQEAKMKPVCLLDGRYCPVTLACTFGLEEGEAEGQLGQGEKAGAGSADVCLRSGALGLRELGRYHRLLTKSVAETPVHKQMSRRLLHRQIQGRSADPAPEMDVVEESPEKGDQERGLRRSPRLKQLSFSRTKSGSFYSASQPKSRSVQRVHAPHRDKPGAGSPTVECPLPRLPQGPRSRLATPSAGTAHLVSARLLSSIRLCLACTGLSQAFARSSPCARRPASRLRPLTPISKAWREAPPPPGSEPASPARPPEAPPGLSSRPLAPCLGQAWRSETSRGRPLALGARCDDGRWSEFSFQTPKKTSRKPSGSPQTAPGRPPRPPQSPLCTPERPQRPPMEVTPAKQAASQGPLGDCSLRGWGAPSQLESGPQSRRSLAVAPAPPPLETTAPGAARGPGACPPACLQGPVWPPSPSPGPEGSAGPVAPALSAAGTPVRYALRTPPRAATLGVRGQAACVGTPPDRRHPPGPGGAQAEEQAQRWRDRGVGPPERPGDTALAPPPSSPKDPPLGDGSPTSPRGELAAPPAPRDLAGRGAPKAASTATWLSCPAPAAPPRASQSPASDSAPLPPAGVGAQRSKMPKLARGLLEHAPGMPPASGAAGADRPAAASASPWPVGVRPTAPSGSSGGARPTSPLLAESDTEPLTLLDEAEPGDQHSCPGSAQGAADTETTSPCPSSGPGSPPTPSYTPCRASGRRQRLIASPQENELLEAAAASRTPRSPQTYEVELEMQASGLPKLRIKKVDPGATPEAELPGRGDSAPPGPSAPSAKLPSKPEPAYLPPPCLWPSHSTPGKGGGQTYICQSCTPTRCLSSTPSPFQTDVGCPWTPSPKHSGKTTPEPIKDWPRRKRAVDCSVGVAGLDPAGGALLLQPEGKEPDLEFSASRTPILGDFELEGVCQLPEQSPPWEAVPRAEDAFSWAQFGLGSRKRRLSAKVEAESQPKRAWDGPGARSSEAGPPGAGGWQPPSAGDDVFAAGGFAAGRGRAGAAGGADRFSSAGCTPPPSCATRGGLSASGLQALTQSPLLFQGQTPGRRADASGMCGVPGTRRLWPRSPRGKFIQGSPWCPRMDSVAGCTQGSPVRAPVHLGEAPSNPVVLAGVAAAHIGPRTPSPTAVHSLPPCRRRAEPEPEPNPGVRRGPASTAARARRAVLPKVAQVVGAPQAEGAVGGPVAPLQAQSVCLPLDEEADVFPPAAEVSPLSHAFSRSRLVRRTYTRKKLIS
ncbi:Treslin [Galemys pyrenaicus]|uniref:Treslin n=1 Tax=Galemys pyrenaicus TaxID=202257 RepID=A0A8J6DPV4_GALPY|nr:Treslin [Galemys pyrenaicus]